MMSSQFMGTPMMYVSIMCCTTCARISFPKCTISMYIDLRFTVIFHKSITSNPASNASLVVTCQQKNGWDNTGRCVSQCKTYSHMQKDTKYPPYSTTVCGGEEFPLSDRICFGVPGACRPWWPRQISWPTVATWVVTWRSHDAGRKHISSNRPSDHLCRGIPSCPCSTTTEHGVRKVLRGCDNGADERIACACLRVCLYYPLPNKYDPPSDIGCPYHIRLLPVANYIAWHVVLQGVVGGIFVRKLWMVYEKGGCGVRIRT